ncbi:hypothetical protein [Gardnerella leopoldii]|uniref:hypothetical protein n=1 Tax=Gardnerella leopoldii TaxID=2792978 RepID=UPI001572CE58|nr:hypothetical protein [Gardnerella vaginalis]
MFPQRRRNSLSKIMRVICGFTSCVLTLATLAIVPITPSSASTEETTPKTSKSAEINGNQELKNKDEHKSDKKAEQQPVSNLEQHTSATANTNPKNEVSNKDKEADQNSKNKKAKNAAEAAQTGSNGDRSTTNNNQASAQFYNPVYDEDFSPNITAGSFDSSTSNMSAEPMSVKNKKKKNIKIGKLPAGTWFELKKSTGSDAKNDAYEWASFEGEQCDTSAGNTSEENEQCKKTKPIPATNSDGYGVITFKPNRWTKAGHYKVHVLVHYPDNTTSDDKNAGNSVNNESTPVYAYVDVAVSSASDNDLNLSIQSEDNENSFIQFTNDENLILMNGKEVEHTSFDATVNLGQGNISQRMICYKKDKDGKPVDRKYESGGINGLTLDKKDVKVWKHASYKQQKKCFDDPSHGCNMAEFLYDDYVYDKYAEENPGYVAKKVNEHTVGKLTGSPKESGDFACRVYALKNDIKADGTQNDSIVTTFDTIASQKSYNIAEINSALEKDSGLFKTGITWQSKELNITVRNMSYYYQPFYKDGIHIVPEREKKTVVPISACKVGKCKKNVRSGALPDGTWFEIANYPSEKNNKIPDWAYFDGKQSNKPKNADSKTGEDNSENSGKKYGKITVRISAWMKQSSYKIPVIAHYPDGSSSADLDSSNEGKPIYLNVTVENRPTVTRNDLQLRVRANPIEKITGADPDSFDDDVDSDQGIFLMRGVGSMNNYLDAWSLRDVGNKISLKVLCTKSNKDGSVDTSATWSSSVNGLSAGKDNQWGHVESKKDFDACNTNPGTCIADRKLYQRDVDFRFSKTNPLKAVERTDSVIGGAPKETGDYQCVVYALKPTALAAYTNKVGSATSVQNGDTLLNGVAGLEKGKDWTMTAVKIHVVEPFKLPKTGFAGWNMILSVATTIFTSLMVLAFALDQTQWGRAFMKNFVYQNSAQKVSEIAVQKGTEVSARKGTEIKEKK